MCTSRYTQALDEALQFVPAHQGRLVLALGEAKQYHKNHPVEDGILNGGTSEKRIEMVESNNGATIQKLAEEHRELTAQPLVKLGIPLPLALEIVDLFIL